MEIALRKASPQKSKASICREVVDEEKKDIMVYCSSPGIIRDLYISHLDTLPQDSRNDDLVTWISSNITDQWYLIEALKRGVGIHHGRLPRFISQEMIRRFSDGRIDVLLCTSTVIEGVNTNAKSIIIYNNKKAFNAGYLTFKNISGRAGRMFKHFSGRVYCFEVPPADEAIVVNDPIGSSDAKENVSLLNLLEDDSLSPKQKSDVESHRSSTALPAHLLKQNLFIPIDVQEEVVAKLDKNMIAFQDITGPSLSTEQVIRIFEYLDILGLSMRSLSHVSNRHPNNTACWAVAMRTQAFLSEGIIGLARSMSKDKTISDEGLEDAFNFSRNCIGFNLPKYIRVLDRLQKYVSGPFAGNLEPFANRLEFLDTYPVYVQLDELGVPVEFSKHYRLSSESIDTAARDILKISHHVSGFDGYIAKTFIESY